MKAKLSCGSELPAVKTRGKASFMTFDRTSLSIWLSYVAMLPSFLLFPYSCYSICSTHYQVKDFLNRKSTHKVVFSKPY